MFAVPMAPVRTDLAAFEEYRHAFGRETPAQLSQDLWVLWMSGGKRNGWFVEFGAADGQALSNTLLLESQFGWTGVVAEPHPDFATSLRENRRCAVSTKCVWVRSGETVTFRCTGSDPHLSRMVDVDPADGHEGSRNANFRDVPVETVSLNDLLRASAAPRDIDYLSIDTEGSEFMILESLDFDRWRPRLITAEHNHTPMRDQIHQLLSAQGYARMYAEHTQWDDWYYLQR